MTIERAHDDARAQFLDRGRRTTWGLAALVVAGSDDASGPLQESARLLLVELGLVRPDLVDGHSHPRSLTDSVRALSLLVQAAGVADGGLSAWHSQSDAAMRSQGEASVAGAEAFRELVLPHMPDLGRRLDAPGARMLDVGTGVAALAVAYARLFPHLEIVGIDLLDRPLQLARDTVALAAGSVADRIELRQESVATLQDPEGFDLVWIPAPFIAEEALAAGLTRAARHLRPGGWLMMAHGRDDGDSAEQALDRFQTAAWGGTVLDSERARTLLAAAGFAYSRTLWTPPGAPAITVASDHLPATNPGDGPE